MQAISAEKKRAQRQKTEDIKMNLQMAIGKSMSASHKRCLCSTTLVAITRPPVIKIDPRSAALNIGSTAVVLLFKSRVTGGSRAAFRANIHHSPGACVDGDARSLHRNRQKQPASQATGLEMI